MRTKGSRLVNGLEVAPLPVFMGGVSKSFLFLSDTSQALYFAEKIPFIPKKNVFGQSIFGLSYCSILSRPRLRKVADS